MSNSAASRRLGTIVTVVMVAVLAVVSIAFTSPANAQGADAPTNGPAVDLRGCPEGFVSDDSLGGLCARFEPAVQGANVCPDGARGEPGSCYILVAMGPGILECPEGTLAGTVCVIVGPPPTPGEPTCPVSATVISDGDECFRLVAPDMNGDCPVGTTPDAGSLCREPVAPVPGALMCSDGFGLVNGTCVRYIEPTREFRCPTGSTLDDDGNCRRPVADSPGAYYCEDPQAALNGTSCVFTAAFVATCFGKPVTIDMRDGSPGTGTLGDDVILGTSRGDIIEGFGGNDTICARGGDDYIDGARGNDLIDAGPGSDAIVGGAGNDDLRGGPGTDSIRAGSGDDIVRGGAGGDSIRGSAGNDDLRGGGGGDFIAGDRGNDVLRGQGGADVLIGNADDDVCIGGAGIDQMTCETYRGPRP